MRQNDLFPPLGSRKARKRVGRGNGSGHGTFSGRGIKGQKSRSGLQILRGFEGGQLPIIKRLPRKRGFHNIFRKEYSPVNVGSLNLFEEGTEITPEKLYEAGFIDSLTRPVKILADGQLKNAVTVKANKFSEAAKAKIEAAGGKVEEI
ncbi:MAG: 50S ribosomal protein L15 [Dehalococcoidales bacterium]|nr:50S ribosomal protein L15 [Dehalococcoidales bacterium]